MIHKQECHGHVLQRIYRAAGILMMMLAMLTATCGVASAAWLGSDWEYRKEITIDHSKVQADLIDFPILVSLTSSNFDFTKSYSNGYDIRFTSSNGTTLLEYDRERHDAANQVAEYWVKIPSLSSTVDTVIYMYYSGGTTSRHETFVDAVDVDSQSGLSYNINRPVKNATNPIFGDSSWTWDRDMGYVTVLTNDSWALESRYRKWYQATGPSAPVIYFTCYTYSSDCENWIKPNLGIHNYGGNTNNNILLDRDHSGFSSIVYDPDGATNEKYVLQLNTGPDVGGNAESTNEIFASASPDGGFALVKTLPVWQSVAGKPGHGMGLAKRDDGRWYAYYQYWTGAYREIGAYLSDTTNLSGDWTDIGVLIHGTAGSDQRHSIEINRHAGIYYSWVPKMATKIGPMMFFVSRDGTTFTEKDPIWLPFGANGLWDDDMILEGNFVQVGNEWWYHYCGSASTSGPPYDRYIGLAKIGYDRIGSVSATGTLTADAITPSDKLYVNVDASGGGKLEIELLDASDDSVITGYAQTDFDDITTDTYSTEATWGGNSIPTSQRVKIKFYLDSVELYAYQIGETAIEVLDDVSSSSAWNANFLMVQHLQETVTDEGTLVDIHTDSTINANHGDQHGNDDIAAQIGKGQDFDGIDDYIDCGDFDIGTDALTISGWIRKENVDQTDGQIISKRVSGSDNSFQMTVPSDNFLSFEIWTSNVRCTVISSAAFTSPATWYYVNGVYNGTHIMTYVNGEFDTPSITPATGNVDSTVDPVRMGWIYDSGHTMNGTLDEIRISNTARSAGWINASHNNQYSPSTFYGIGAEENAPAGTTYTPPAPTNLQHTTSVGWVNYTWGVGSGNVTDSYNVLHNDVWTNGSSNTYKYNNVGEGNWSNITVYAWNNSGTGTLSTGSVSDQNVAPASGGSAYTPPTPTNLQHTTSMGWVNYTWGAGSGNITNSYNVYINSIWHNSSPAYYNTPLSAHAWGNITIYAYNNSGTGTLSAAGISQNTQLPNNPIAITNGSDWNGDIGENVYVDYGATDADSDTPTFSCSRIDLFTDFNTGTGVGNWIPTANGTYSVNFGVSDGYGSTSNHSMTIQVGDVPASTLRGMMDDDAAAAYALAAILPILAIAIAILGMLGLLMYGGEIGPEAIVAALSVVLLLVVLYVGLNIIGNIPG